MERQAPALAIEGMLELLLLTAFPDGLPEEMDRQAVLAAMAQRLAAMRPDLAVLKAGPGPLAMPTVTHVAERAADPETRERQVREDLARRLGAEQTEVDVDAVERAFRIHQAIEAHIRQALHPPGIPAGAPLRAAAGAPLAAAVPVSVEPTVEDKLRALQAFHQERKARLQSRSDIVRLRRGKRAPQQDAAAASEVHDPPAEGLSVHLDQDATAIGRDRLRIESTSSGRGRDRRRPAID